MGIIQIYKWYTVSSDEKQNFIDIIENKLFYSLPIGTFREVQKVLLNIRAEMKDREAPKTLADRLDDLTEKLQSNNGSQHKLFSALTVDLEERKKLRQKQAQIIEKISQYVKDWS